MKIAVAQINTTVGDFAGNAERIRRAVDAAREAGAKLVVAPEMALSGYPAEDLWLRDDFCDQCTAELMRLAPYCTDVARRRGLSAPRGPHALQRRRGAARRAHRAGLLQAAACPTTRVFDEKRYFETGNRPCVFEVEGRKVGLTICEDLWFPEPAAQAKAAGAQLLVSINASPFNRAQQAERYTRMGARVKETQAAAALRARHRRPGRAGLRRRLLRPRRRGPGHLPGRDLPSSRSTSSTSTGRRRAGPDGQAAHRGGDHLPRAHDGRGATT